MDFENIYEVSKFPFPEFGLCWLFVCCLTAQTVVQCVKDVRNDLESISKALKLFFWGFIFIVVLTGTILIWSNKGSELGPFADEYYAGNYKIVEGYIEDCHNGNLGNKIFYVDGMMFNLVKYINHPIPDEGYLRVYYVELEEDYYEVVRIDRRLEKE